MWQRGPDGRVSFAELLMPMMRAMVFDRPGQPLVMRERPIPRPGPGEILVEVSVCGVCRTDLHVVDGELPDPRLPLVPGHEIVGRVAALGAGVTGFTLGERVGVPWLGATCGHCPYCRTGRENLCDTPLFTGYTRDGGYATHAVADANYCFALAQANAALDDLRSGRLQGAAVLDVRGLRTATINAT
jgi:alcohol dehydrogenase, propanol-preferring